MVQNQWLSLDTAYGDCEHIRAPKAINDARSYIKGTAPHYFPEGHATQ
jgi:hypothetical protein